MKHIIFFIGITSMLAACKHEDLMPYEAADAVYIYKLRSNVTNDSTVYSFAIRPSTLQVDTVYIPLRIMGNPRDYDREVKAEVIAGQTTASRQNYELLPATIKANSFNGTLPVKLIKTPELKDKEVVLSISLVASSDFKSGIKENNSYRIRINDFLSQPLGWNITHLGIYSRVKYSFFIQVTGVTVVNGMNSWELRSLVQKCKNALLDYRNEHNEPLYDENNQIVEFP